MHDRPISLEDFCIDSLCDSVNAMCASEAFLDSSMSENLAQIVSSTPPPTPSIDEVKFTSPTSSPSTISSDTDLSTIIIPVYLSDKLLWRMCEKDQLDNRTMKFFTSSRTTLKNVKIADCAVNHSGLEILKQHSLDSLKLINLKDIQFDRFLAKCISEETLDNLRILDLSGTLRPTRIRCDDSTSTTASSTSSGEIIVDNVHLICQFKNLTALCVADTQFGDSGMYKICAHLAHLEFLDISHTRVSDIQPLAAFKDQLRTLLMHRPKIRNVAETVETLSSLNQLRVLDISDFPKLSQSTCADVSRGQLGVMLVRSCIDVEDVRLKQLQILDLSGSQANFDVNVFSSFLATHGNLEFCGLLMSNACYFDSVLALNRLKVSGEANRKQIFLSLETYWSRDYFCSRSMYLLFSMLQDDYTSLTNEEKQFCIQNIIKGLTSNLNSLSVQMAGTACLFNLCRSDRAQSLHPSLLRQIVDRSLTAVETHGKTLQLHKNVWLTLCNDYILQSGTFNMFRCCSAALESMVRCGDNSVTRMTVAIVSILAAKIPTELTTKLGTNHLYMRFLLQVVVQKIEHQLDWYKQNSTNGANVGQIGDDSHFDENAPPPDITLKFTLSALWNLTDESPSTCLCFLDANGLDVVLKVLDIFRDHSIETKVLGLLNNVAEVVELKNRLVTPLCLGIIRRLLKSSKIDVSYFSAGILAHLCADLRWDHVKPTWTDCLNALESSINEWAQPDTEMVAYRSFKPFFSLLSKDQLPAVQLWAVWAIRHVCSKNTERYVDMFISDGGREALERVKTLTSLTYPIISQICEDVLKFLV